MPRIKSKTVYSYNELSDKAKETARNEIQERTTQEDWWDAVYEDADAIAAMLGIELDRKKVPLHGGGVRQDPAIFFSGFSSQGDGACYEGHYTYKPGAVKAIKEYAPKDDTLHAIAARLAAIQKRAFYQIEVFIKQDGNYLHEYSMDFTVGRTDGKGSNAAVFSNIKETLRAFARWIYRQLEQEYNYHGSEEYCAEEAEANDWEFNEDGTFSD